MPVDRSLPIPLHVQVEELLLSDLDAGTWQPGERLPAEPVLAARFGVNRLTVREAIASLRRTGRVVARQGSGTFVATPPLRIDLDAAGRPAGDAARTAMATFREPVLDVRRTRLTGEARTELGVDEGLEIETLALLSDAPVMHTVYSIASAATADEARAQLDGPWLPDRFEALVGTSLRSAWRAFDAVPARRHEAALLDVEPGSPILRRSGVNVDADGVARTFHVRAYRSDRLRIVLRD
ncbi:GntR family transcriptional regulator [Demequina mangrovi]|uniref:Transcriptional regulator, GntR family n=1 Tax=Demequina mangrovi TaxID=1043493 RepID=A0A1H6X9M7_9MICO|nr:GntR family transcriptional regulator [Demequina mangrovi]SEJ23307.1 transcriptional regulator, GntR family [Demequina mangrovi]